MNRDERWNEYGQWLASLVNSKYSTRLSDLHFLEFTWEIERDRNRASDGMHLRKKFAAETDIPIGIFDRMPCSVLEMLVALAIRVEREFVGDPNRPNPGRFFLEMLDNLGIVSVRKGSDSLSNRRIIQRWLLRDFRDDGDGSPFPLREPRRDQRDIEIWDQMNAYLFENY